MKQIEKLTKKGRYPEGSVRGVCLQVSSTGARSWLLRYERNGRERWHGLGSLSEVDLGEARRRAIEARRLLWQGVDPIDARRPERYGDGHAGVREISR